MSELNPQNRQGNGRGRLRLVYTTQFRTYMNLLPERVDMALEIIGGILEGHAKEYCPVSNGDIQQGGTYPGGRLRDSITHGLSTEKEHHEIVGTNVEYAPFVELGHAQRPGRFVPAIGRRLVASHVAARPYLRPALENHREEYWGVIERVFQLDSEMPEGTPQEYNPDQQQDRWEPEQHGQDQHEQDQHEPDGEGPWVVID